MWTYRRTKKVDHLHWRSPLKCIHSDTPAQYRCGFMPLAPVEVPGVNYDDRGQPTSEVDKREGCITRGFDFPVSLDHELKSSLTPAPWANLEESAGALMHLVRRSPGLDATLKKQTVQRVHSIAKSPWCGCQATLAGEIPLLPVPRGLRRWFVLCCLCTLVWEKQRDTQTPTWHGHTLTLGFFDFCACVLVFPTSPSLVNYVHGVLAFPRRALCVVVQKETLLTECDIVTSCSRQVEVKGTHTHRHTHKLF